jgi:hypothetical protein
MAETSVVNFKTPAEFISYYSDVLKEELGVYDLQINKLGFIGFLLNLLGHTNYDAKQYYDSLFKEAFVATSQDTENLYFHASTYGYLPTFATSSLASGEVVFDFALLPKMLPGVIKREVVLGKTDSFITFEVDGYKFITDTKYKFVQTLEGYSSIVTNIEGQVTQLPSASAEIRAPFQNVRQYESLNFSLTLPNYSFGSYYPYVIEISDGHIEDIRVWVKTRNVAFDLLEEYSVNYVKYFEESYSKTVFLRKLTSRKFVIEFGSGIRGAYVPAASVVVNVKVTKGVKGNLLKESTIVPSGYITVINYYDAAHSNLINTLPVQSASKFIKVNFQYSENGKDPLSGDALRNDVVNHIQSYDMLVSERDFYNITQKYMNDFKFLFKKSDASINTFYLCRSFRDKYQIVCPTVNHTIKKIDSFSVVENLLEIIVDDPTGLIDAESFYYIVVPSDGFNSATEVQSAVIDTTSRKMLITEEFTFENGSSEVICNTQIGFDAINLGDYIMAEGETVDLAIEVIAKDDASMFVLTLASEYQGENFMGQLEVYQPTRISLAWDEVTDANKYLVYKVVGSDYYFAETFTNSIDDDGTNFIACDYPLNPDLIFYPKFMINGELMISPFLYKWNSFMRWYDGYILYDSFSAHFSETKNTGLANYDIPVLYFFIQYDMLNRKTYIDLKSHQDISSFEFELTISERSIYSQNFVSLDSTTWRYEYSEENGIFWEEFHIELSGKKGTDQSFKGSTYTINQVYNINDQLTVLTYDMYIYSGPGVLDHIDNYIINIPLLSYDRYIEDPEFYLDKSKQFIVDHNVQGKRMISDNLQFRFLDTLTVPAYYLENFTVQKYNSFDIKFPLQVSINIIVDSEMVVNQKINLADKKNQFLLMLADWLQKTHTGTKICFYNSQIVDLIHTDQVWIKSVEVILKDANDTVIPSGIETIPDTEGLENIRDNKLAIIKYSSWFWHWNVDNIDIKMII